MNKPTQPFQVIQFPFTITSSSNLAMWSVPFDQEFRSLEVPNANDAIFNAYASIGLHVTREGVKYVPSYKLISKIETLHIPTSQVDNWLSLYRDRESHTIILDKTTNTYYVIISAFSVMESVVSWFSREGKISTVLCIDSITGQWYIEHAQQDLVVNLSNGTEIADSDVESEIVKSSNLYERNYLVKNHPNAVMIHGD